MAFDLNLTNFSFVTVMNVRAWTQDNINQYGPSSAPTADPDLYLDSLSISNVTQEGPNKEARGGVESRPIIRHKKTVRIDMEDVVMKAGVLDTFMGGINQATEGSEFLSVTEEFATYLYLTGETYVVNREDGSRQWVKIEFYNFLPDSVFDLTMEAEGDIGMINIGGELFSNEDGEFFRITTITGPTAAPQ